MVVNEGFNALKIDETSKLAIQKPCICPEEAKPKSLIEFFAGRKHLFWVRIASKTKSHQ